MINVFFFLNTRLLHFSTLNFGHCQLFLFGYGIVKVVFLSLLINPFLTKLCSAYRKTFYFVHHFYLAPASKIYKKFIPS